MINGPKDISSLLEEATHRINVSAWTIRHLQEHGRDDKLQHGGWDYEIVCEELERIALALRAAVEHINDGRRTAVA